MAWQITKVLVASVVIGFTSWRAGKNPQLAGFLVALPLTSILALVFTQAEYHEWQKSVHFARSILAAIPLSLLFFVPFLVADCLKWPFWGLLSGGIVLLACGYVVHCVLFR